MLSESTGSLINGVATFLKTSTTTYAGPGQANGFVALQGVNPSTQGEDPSQDEIFYSERRIPARATSTELQDVQFSWQANSFDRFARPDSETRSSSLGFSRSDATSYFDDSNRWVIGQVASVTDQATGKVMSRTDFDLASDLPIRSYSFGLLRQTLSYNSDGTLATARDGRNNIVTVGNWYRGVPRNIGYPSGASESASVNPTGTIATTTDELGSQTSYGYDAMGRLTSLRYPSGDAVAWTDTLSRFERINAPEYGLPGGHWKRVASTGNGQVSTFYDGRWQPVLTLTEVAGDAATKSFQVKRFNVFGQEVFASYALAALSDVGEPLNGVSSTYDALGRVTQVRQDSELGVLTSSTEYLAGFKTRTTNPRGYQTVTSYQVFDSPDTSRPMLIQAPEGSTTTITRDGFGKPLQVTRSGP
jgi:YD repeat-containing protein